MTTSLEEERDFLLRSIVDLDAERAAGDIDSDDYDRLRDDYTARAAAVLRRLESSTPARSVGEPSSPRETTAHRTTVVRRAAAIAAVVAVAAGAGWLVAASAGERVADQPASGSLPEASTDRIARAQRMVAAGNVLDAIKTYDDLLADDPENPVALAERGWLLSRIDPRLTDRGLESIDKALALDPEYAEAHFYRGMILLQSKNDPAGAAAAFDKAIAGNPPPDLRTFLEDARDRAQAQAQTQAP